jgi:hypothetical protein
MGVVVAAHHMQLDEKVALKFLLPHAVESAESVARFLREARAAVRIKNEHVARVIDVGKLENGSPYMVMEYLEGCDLGEWLDQRGPLPVAQAVDFLLQACEAVADAHALGIVHRDLKPANLFCIRRSDGEFSIKVLDFGISKITTPGAPGHDMTRTSALMGSPLYMSPEQMQHSKGVDARTDIWALGIILFELLAGQPPFTAEAVTHLAIKVANEPAPPLRALRSDAPAGLEQIVATCLEKDRSRRFRSVGELAIALKDFGPKHARLSVERVLGTLRNAGLTGAVLPPSGGYRAARGARISAPGSMPQTAATWGNTGAPHKPTGKPAVWIVGGAIALVALLAVAGVAVWQKPRAPAVAPTTSTTIVATTPDTVGDLAPSPAAETSDAPAIAGSASPATSASARAAPATALAKPASNPTASAPPPQPAQQGAPLGCDPPYSLDAQGRKHFKPECYLKR